ncbi:MAG: Ig-like domain-containing protein, partial [bacterium]|nr:Ig-like domain-containing protein [bacterium]
IILTEMVEDPADGRGSFAHLVARTSRLPPADGRPERIVAAPEDFGSGLLLEGIVQEGLYLVLHAQVPVGFCAGTVRAPNDRGLRQSRVTAETLGTADLSGDAGRYATVVAAGVNRNLFAVHPSLDEIGSATLAGLNPGAIATVDITVAPVGPTVVGLTPADGAIEQLVGSNVIVHLSEALDEASVSSQTLSLELANARGEPTGALISGTVSLANGT